MVETVVKLIGAGLVLAGCTASGNYVARTFTDRVSQLGHLRTGLQVLETEIAWAVNSLPFAMDRVSKAIPPPCSRVFARTGELLISEGLVAADAWRRALDEAVPGTALTRRDVEILLAFGTTLGVSDREDQIRHIRLAQAKLAAEESAAAENSEKSAKLWRQLGFAVGAVIVITLI